MTDWPIAAENVVAVKFRRDSDAYTALICLKESDFRGLLRLHSAAVVARVDGGEVRVMNEVGDTELSPAATGGVLGLLICVLAGPFGVLIGGATGVLADSLFDDEDEDDTESILSDISNSVRVGRVALLAQVTEQCPDVLDTSMRQLGGTVLRRAGRDVEAEIAAAEDAQRDAKRAARKRLRERRHDERDQKIHAKVAQLKAKLHHRETSASTRG